MISRFKITLRHHLRRRPCIKLVCFALNEIPFSLHQIATLAIFPVVQVVGPGALNAKAKKAATPRKANATI